MNNMKGVFFQCCQKDGQSVITHSKINWTKLFFKIDKMNEYINRKITCYKILTSVKKVKIYMVIFFYLYFSNQEY